jgi:hypothetical protein
MYIYIVITVKYCTYQKLLAYESASVTHALSHSQLSRFQQGVLILKAFL